jgi:carboxyl-terminal processing protease
MRVLKNNLIVLLFISFINNINAQIDREQIYKFEQVIENISNFYVDSVNESALVEKAIVAMLKELDPHSIYYPKEEAEEINKGLIGSFTGIGITYDIINDTVMIISVLDSCPAQNAGLLPGDRILKINNRSIAGIKITDKQIRELFVGVKGTQIILDIKRKKSENPLRFNVSLDEIPINSIVAFYIYQNDIAFIKLNRFGAKTINEFKSVSDSLIKSGINKIIIDLRDNSGGYLYASVNLLENFLEKNMVVLYTQGENNPKKEYKTQTSGNLKKIDLVVLMDESTASAGEIFCGAIQDWDRGVIIGRRSFGKGLVQKPVYLIDGSLIRLTIARYYTPSGRNIQKPYSSDFSEYENDLNNRLNSGELINRDSIKICDSLKFYTLTNHRLIYGGGGILPDIFIPIDTLKLPNNNEVKMNNKTLNEFIHLFVDKHRTYFKNNFPDFQTFYQKFTFSQENMNELIDYIYKNNVNAEYYKQNLLDNKLFLTRIKALIADDLYTENEFYKIYNLQDSAFLKAVYILRNKQIYNDILTGEIVGDYND